MDAEVWNRQLVDTSLLGVIDPRVWALYMAIRRYAWVGNKKSIFEDVQALTDRGKIVAKVNQAKLGMHVGLKGAVSVSRLIGSLRELGWLETEGPREKRLYALGEWKKVAKGTGGVAVFWFDAYVQTLGEKLHSESKLLGFETIHSMPLDMRLGLTREIVDSRRKEVSKAV